MVWRLLASTVGACLRYRVTGLAAEAAFFAILSLPPLVFGLAGSIGYFADRYDVGRGGRRSSDQILDARSAGADRRTRSTDRPPTLEQVLEQGRVDVISLGFVLALWSGSRALNVFVDTITIMYGLGGRRGIVRTRALSFSLYVIALVLGIVVRAAGAGGPALVADLVPDRVSWLESLYWPIVLVLTIAFVTTLYHLSVPVRTSWRYDVPGAVLTLGGVDRRQLGAARHSAEPAAAATSIYGPLAAPIAVLLWLYIAVHRRADRRGAERVVRPGLPGEDRPRGARLELVRRLRDKAMAARMREAGLDDRGLAVLSGAAGPTKQEAAGRAGRHHHRVSRRRAGAPRRAGCARATAGCAAGVAATRRAADPRRGPPPVDPDDETELMERPRQTR